MAKKSLKKKDKKTTKNTSESKEQVKNKEVEIKDTKTKQDNIKNVSGSVFDWKMLKKLLPVFFILLIMWYAFFIRSGPINLDGMRENIEASTYAKIKNLLSQEIDADYPNLSPQYKQEKLNQKYAQVLATGKINIEGQDIVIADIVNQNVEYIKSAFKAENGQTYLNAIDPYHFYKLSENYLTNGHTGTTIKNIDGEDTPWIEYKLAPKGALGTYKPEFHVWLEHKIFELNNIDKNSSIGEKFKAIYLLPVIFVMLSVIPIYLIIRKLSNDYFAILGSMLLVSVETLVSRTIAGFVDTDAYNIFFPLLILAFIVYAFLIERKTWKYLLIGLAGLFQGIYLWAWDPSWYLFVFISISILGYLGYLVINLILKHFTEKNINNQVNIGFILFLIYNLSSYIFVWLFARVDIFVKAYNGIIIGLSGFATISVTNIWPNVLSSVAELKPASFSDVISSVGGGVIFFLGMISLVFLTIDFKTESEKVVLYKRILIIASIFWFTLFLGTSAFLPIIANWPLIFLALFFLPVICGFIFSIINNNISAKIFISILLSSWIGGTIYLSLNGVRFIVLLAPAFAIAFAVGLYYIAEIINKFFITEFKIENKYGKYIAGYLFMLILFVIFFIPIFNNDIKISNGTVPNFDDAWFESMYKIRDNSAPDAIITSWWDFGHFFAAIAERGVTFDGGSQTTPQSHWVGKLLLESDEDVSRDILRMLVCGANTAFEYMLEISNDETNGILVNKLIYQTLGKSKEEKVGILRNNKYFTFSDSQVDEIMNRLACDNPREDFLITSEDMVGKAGVWAHWGSWDFTRKYVYDNYKRKSAEEIAMAIDEDEELIRQYIEELNEIDVRAVVEDIKRTDLVNQWFAPYPSYIPLQNQYLYPCQAYNQTLACANSVVVDLISGRAQSGFDSSVTFNNLVFPDMNGSLKIYTQNPEGDIDLVFIPSQAGYNVLLAQSPLGTSLFTKLFYFNGMFGNEYFEEFDSFYSAGGIKVITWKVKWEDVNESEIYNETINI